MKTKIALGGEIQIGKSTLLKKLLKETELPICGFMTQLDRSAPVGNRPLYIYSASLPEENRVNSDENRLGIVSSPDLKKAYAERFDELACPMLENIPENGIVIMDELGFLESGAEGFKKKVFEILNDDHYAIIVIKDRFDVPFLNELRSLPQLDYYKVTKENRDTLFDELKSAVSSWK